MNIELINELGLALAGLLVGAALAAVACRLRLETVLAAGVAEGRAPLEVELSTQVERLHAAEAELLLARKEVRRLQDAAENWRKAYEASAHDQARLGERSTRVPQLESEVARLMLQLNMGEEERRRLTASEAQKEESLRSLRLQLRQLEENAGGLQARLDASIKALREVGERRASLEQQAARTGALQEQLRDQQVRQAMLSQQLLDLREASARDSGRLCAELAAARQAAEGLQSELANAQQRQAAAEARVAELAREAAQAKAASEADAVPVPVAARLRVPGLYEQVRRFAQDLDQLRASLTQAQQLLVPAHAASDAPAEEPPVLTALPQESRRAD